MKSGNAAPESLRQRAARAIGNALFGLFVAVVLLLTVFAVTYQPPDPWLDTAASAVRMKQLFNKVVDNATFQTAGSIFLTGEDALAPANSRAGGSISIEDAQDAAEKALEATRGLNNGGKDRGCVESDIVVNCSDPGVLAAIEKVNLEKFPEIDAFEYRVPVQGGDERSCDVAWKYRPRRERSKRMYRDYRRYTLVLEPSCEYQVTDVGDWHSGRNARLQRFHGINAFNDSISSRGDDDSSSVGRFLYYTRGGDHCKGMKQFMWSFLCALGEAQYLNRTLVVDLGFCLSGKDNFPGRGDEPGKDLRFYIDFDHLRESTSVIELKEFSKLNKKHKLGKIRKRVISDNVKVSPMELRDETSTTVERSFRESSEPDNYWYRVCEGETEKVIQRPWHMIWKSKRLMNIVNTICGKLEWDFDAVRVERGEKAANRQLWPNLDKDTSAEAVLSKLSGRIDAQRYVYISTNERSPGFFHKLKEKYEVSVLDDYKDLWGPGSEWYNETMALTRGKPVEFDGYMRDAVDSEMFLRGKKRIETFGDLTSDCKDGINTC
ncbi:hypothetical protein SELMODRAFT_128681 [Selaginella moellendorffii]|uniref:Uncharacterized protein SUB1A-2 n=1 Tax=Selaginella moellendorffii TaxID=88036 RepID=D8SZR5_SELML|nr:uncharacterized protein LOC9661217 [Selaginella moellendorffii]XP_024518390.1 uncharacterized protein LOC9661217 [Selaginella moellendorffii]EFJ10131.1 hypothetical protein SELMODRAFT_128681 [Selaginella moellendorffii]|eukprot:XP_002988869.1 uncharacterized protein LOC9661217 [Selaginella moellendorffii]